jgi:hypothetical protein
VSNYFGNTELLYSYAGQATQLATFTTEANLQATYPLCQIPGSYFATAGTGQGGARSLRVKAAGQIGFTTGAPTFLWSIRAIASTTWSAGGLLLGATAALATGASAVVTTPWFLDADISQVLAEVAGATAPTTASVKTMGEVRAPAALATPFTATIPSLAVSPTIATWDINATYYLFLSCACGTSNSLNLINLQMLKVWGEN